MTYSNFAIVLVNHIHKYFRRGSERVGVLQDRALEVPDGQFAGPMGTSGSGKTTLLNLEASGGIGVMGDSALPTTPISQRIISE
jgi:putative ABC transport system ATP-binding protein